MGQPRQGTSVISIMMRMRTYLYIYGNANDFKGVLRDSCEAHWHKEEGNGRTSIQCNALCMLHAADTMGIRMGMQIRLSAFLQQQILQPLSNHYHTVIPAQIQQRCRCGVDRVDTQANS